MDENFSFGYWLRRQRLARDLRQDGLAAQVGVATVTLRKLEAEGGGGGRGGLISATGCAQATMADTAGSRITTPRDPDGGAGCEKQRERHQGRRPAQELWRLPA